MSSKVKLTVKVTGDSSAEFETVVSMVDGGFESRVSGLNLVTQGSSVRSSLQALVKLIQNNGEEPEIPTINYGV